AHVDAPAPEDLQDDPADEGQDAEADQRVAQRDEPAGGAVDARDLGQRPVPLLEDVADVAVVALPALLAEQLGRRGPGALLGLPGRGGLRPLPGRPVPAVPVAHGLRVRLGPGGWAGPRDVPVTTASIPVVGWYVHSRRRNVTVPQRAGASPGAAG